MKHLVNVSGGAASAVALFRVIDRYGRENVSARLADTNSEHADLYRFVDDLERISGVPIVRLNDGRNIWDVFMEEGILTTPNKKKSCVASIRLKHDALDAHALTIGTPETMTIHIGFGPDEDDRVANIIEHRKPWQFDFPLLWEPRMWRCDVLAELKRRGLEECSVYKDGYPHANCLKWNCIKAGIGQWIGVLKDNRAGYLDAEQREQDFLAELARRGREPHTILRDRRGGETKNLSLRQLREEVDAGVKHQVPKWRDSACSCMFT